MKALIVIDVEKCLGCRSCEIACAVAHSQTKELSRAIFETPLPQARVKVEGMGDLVMPLQCRHCEDAPCVSICPTGALEKMGPEQPVLLHEERCIGCRWCLLVCPFGVIIPGRGGQPVTKCDLCIERLKKGEKPACVEACPTGALRFTTVEEVTRQRREEFLVRIKQQREASPEKLK